MRGNLASRSRHGFRRFGVTIAGAAAMVAVSVIGLVFTTERVEAAPATGFVLENYATGVGLVTDLEWAPNGMLFAADKSGVVRVIDNGVVTSTFVDINAEVNSANDRGLLGVAVHPDLLNGSPFVYLLYTYDPPETVGRIGTGGPDGTGQRVARLTRFTADVQTSFTTAVPGSGVTILGNAGNWVTAGAPTAEDTANDPNWACGNRVNIDNCVPADGRSHTIGTVAFGPDAMLYVGNGDAARFEVATDRSFRSLDPDSLAGKIMRIDPISGLGLADNPFWDGNANSNRSRVYQLGLRNPYRFTIHPTGEVWIGDVGEGSWEEVNNGPAGADFGWPCYEGGAAGTLEAEPRYQAFTDCQNYYADNSAEPPRYSYRNTSGAAIVASDFAIGTTWPAEYQNALIVGDFVAARINAVQVRTSLVTEVSLATDVVAVDSTFGPDGELYLASIGSGSVERIRFVGSVQNQLPVANAGADISAVDGDGSGDEVVSLDGTASADTDGVIVSFGWDLGGVSLATGPTPSIVLPVGITTVTLTVTDDAGATATDTVVVTVDPQTPPPPPPPPPPPSGSDITIDRAELKGSRVRIEGSGAVGGSNIVVDGVDLGSAGADGAFRAESRDFSPSSCTVTLTDGVSTVLVDLDGC